MLSSKVIEIDLFKKGSKSEFLLLPIEKLGMELFSYKKKVVG